MSMVQGGPEADNAEQKAEHARMVEALSQVVLQNDSSLVTGTLNESAVLRDVSQDNLETIFPYSETRTTSRTGLPTNSGPPTGPGSPDTLPGGGVIPGMDHFETPSVIPGLEVPTLVQTRTPGPTPPVSLSDQSNCRRAVSVDPAKTRVWEPTIVAPTGRSVTPQPVSLTKSASSPRQLQNGALGGQSLSPRSHLPQCSLPPPTAPYAYRQGTVPYQASWPQVLQSSQVRLAAAPPPRTGAHVSQTHGLVEGHGYQSYLQQSPRR